MSNPRCPFTGQDRSGGRDPDSLSAGEKFCACPACDQVAELEWVEGRLCEECSLRCLSEPSDDRLAKAEMLLRRTLRPLRRGPDGKSDRVEALRLEIRAFLDDSAWTDVKAAFKANPAGGPEYESDDESSG